MNLNSCSKNFTYIDSLIFNFQIKLALHKLLLINLFSLTYKYGDPLKITVSNFRLSLALFIFNDMCFLSMFIRHALSKVLEQLVFEYFFVTIFHVFIAYSIIFKVFEFNFKEVFF
jgi:hypothetical protein